MKKIPLILTLAALSFGVSKAQAYTSLLTCVTQILDQKGLPYTIVDAVDRGTAPEGGINNRYVDFPDYDYPGRFTYNQILCYYQYSHNAVDDTLTDGTWTKYPNIGPQAALNTVTGQNIYLKVKGDGTLKPIQVKSDGSKLLFIGTDGYSYKLIPTVIDNSGPGGNNTIQIFFRPNNQN